MMSTYPLGRGKTSINNFGVVRYTEELGSIKETVRELSWLLCKHAIAFHRRNKHFACGSLSEVPDI